MKRLLLIVTFAVLAFGSARAQYQLKSVAPNLSIPYAVEIVPYPDSSGRLVVLNQKGLAYLINPADSLSSLAPVFLNLQGWVSSPNNSELGLLGITFHPNFATNKKVFVHYNAFKGGLYWSKIVSYTMHSTIADFVDTSTEETLIFIQQPLSNHNGGKMEFGADGYLYISFGDGGGSGDPFNNSQSMTTMLGKMLRIDVDNPAAPKKYGIPPDNPFTNSTVPEIYALGLRNAWKFSVDPVTQKIWAADVGQNRIEEIDTITKGGNYGWRIVEGSQCYNPATNCNTTGLIPPVFEYTQANNNRSITGGYVYRGAVLRDLIGKYIYGDYVSGRIWYLDTAAGGTGYQDRLLLSTGISIATFGVDRSGELYTASYGASGRMFKLVNPLFSSIKRGVGAADMQLSASQMPVKADEARLKFSVKSASKLSIHTLRGEEVYSTDVNTDDKDHLVPSGKLKSGMYVVSLSNSRGAISLKLAVE